jgi:hypothetical protein
MSLQNRVERLEQHLSVALCGAHAARVVHNHDEVVAPCARCGVLAPVVYVPRKATPDEWIAIAADRSLSASGSSVAGVKADL